MDRSYFEIVFKVLSHAMTRSLSRLTAHLSSLDTKFDMLTQIKRKRSDGSVILDCESWHDYFQALPCIFRLFYRQIRLIKSPLKPWVMPAWSADRSSQPTKCLKWRFVVTRTLAHGFFLEDTNITSLPMSKYILSRQIAILGKMQALQASRLMAEKSGKTAWTRKWGPW